ncbi:transcription factor TGA7-like [Ipomoea triloba]|uniref:transcription factor TGA7-like n=1 Tax=Ipomoea triloba TaxID=35885 RepID=UPI00125E1903|nr:transcription factor TGA7-like [Ipomoea triloba]
MVSYQAMNMSSATTHQFAPTRAMAAMYEPFHQMGGWEETLRGDIIPAVSACVVPQATTGIDDKSEYTSSESAAPSGSGDNQPTQSVADKVQRRLAQNREAARKSRLRKKAYVQQLETSRLKLTQLELELQKARQQGLHSFGATRNIALCGTINPGIASFEMDYTHWVEEQQKKNSELRNALQSHMHDMELQMLVDSFLGHYSDLFRMKADVAKADIFYLISGMWVSPIERFFLWLGGYRPSEFISVITPQIEPLTDQQLLNVCNLQLCCQQAEDALTQGMDKLQQTLGQSMKLRSAGAGSFNTQMVSAMENLESLESFINQADHLREQTLQQMCRILTTRQAARGLLAFGEYFQRLRALSSIWAARPYETYD